jgi:hypothetical protein
MESDYRSSDPVLFTICAVLIFAFTSAVFLVYDRLVEKRQKTVMTTAVHTSAIVSSLFPSTVRDRLFETDNDRDSHERNIQDEGFVSFGDKVVSRPIADLYPSATVMFADMYVLSRVLVTVAATLITCFVPAVRATVLVSLLGARAAIHLWSSIYLKTYTGCLTKLLTGGKFSK